MQLWWLLCVMMGAFVGLVPGQTASAWIEGIPSPEAAILKIGATDDVDGKSRQGAALHEIARVILRLGGAEFRGPSRLEPKARELHRRYTDLYERFSRETTERLNQGLSPERLAELGNARPSAAFANLEYSYRSNPAFQRETFQKVMGEEWVARWYQPLVDKERRIVSNMNQAAHRAADESRARSEEIARENFFEVLVRLAGLPTLLAGLVWLVLSWRAVRTDPADALRWTGRSKAWTLRPVTGFASDIRVYTVQTKHTTIRRSGDFRPDEVSTHTTSAHHCEFILNAEDRKHAVHLTDGGLQIGEGHLVSCVWPVHESGKTRGLMLAYNHDTQQRAVFRPVVGSLVGPRFWPGVVVAVGVSLLLNWPTGLLVFLLYLPAIWFMGVRRMREFHRLDLPRIMERLLRPITPAA